MIAEFIGLIKNLFGFGEQVEKLQTQKQDRYNADDMKGNKQAQTDLQERENIERSLEQGDKGNLTEERKEGAE